MSIELKQAAQLALTALEKSQPHPSNPVIGLTKQDFIDHEETIRQLRAAIQQAEARQPATGEPVANDGWRQDRGLLYRLTDEQNPQNRDEIKVMMADSSRSDASCTRRAGELLDRIRATHPAPSVPEFSRIAKLKLDELQKQGFTITGYAIQRGTQRGFITNGGFVGWRRSDEAPRVPEGCALVPIEPTQAMLNVQTWDFSRFYSPREIWAAMLAAK